MLLRFKISLLAVFVLFTLLGIAGANLRALLIGLAALFVSLAIAIIHHAITEAYSENDSRFAP